jgi:hypothetical protein
MLFGGAANAQDASHTVAEDQVASATNIDFDLERGAAQTRRGCVRLYNIGTAAITSIFRNYNNPNNIGASPFYVTETGGKVYRVVSGTATTIVSTQAKAEQGAGIISYRQYAYIPHQVGSLSVKDDGTTTTDWPKFNPSGAPSIAVSTAAAVVVSTVWTVAEGTISGNGTATVTGSTDADTNRVEFNATPLSTNLNTNGTANINDYGIHSLKIKFSNPSVVTRVSVDYSIGGTDFSSYYHAELDPTDQVEQGGEDALPDSAELIESQLSVGTGTHNVDIDVRQTMLSEVRLNPRTPTTLISASGATFNSWVIPRPNHQLVNVANAPEGWTNIGKVRVIVEALSPIVVQLTGWQIAGSEDYPLNDPNVGYAYWTTFAKLDASSNVVSESAPSPPSTRTKMQASAVTITDTNTLAAPSTNDITHKIFYRQGGYLNDAYAIATVTYAGTGTTTVTDRMTDIQALSANFRMLRNILPQNEFYGNAYGAAEAFYDRIFLGQYNYIAWSLPGRPETFPRTSYAQVSNAGDYIRGIIVYPQILVIINRDSVYEMQGNLFEGSASNWTLQRSGSKHGSKAYSATIKTPHGVLLLDYDGLYLYQPGQGVDVPLTWAMERIADVWRGQQATDPAALKGSRVPVLNMPYIDHSVAAFGDDKIYLGLPCGTGTALTDPNTLFVLNFRTKQVQWYTYGFTFFSLFWDQEAARLLAGTSDGKIMTLESGQLDTVPADNTATGITWSVRTRTWTSPSDAVLENLAIDYKGSTATARAVLNATSTVTLGTLTNTTREWINPELSLSGTKITSVEFLFNGTRGTAADSVLYGVGFEALVEPPRVRFYKSDYFAQEDGGESRFDVHYADLEAFGTGSVYGTCYVDGVAVMTTTIVGPTAERNVVCKSYPVEVFGRVAHTIYNAGAGITSFKHWTTNYDRRAEPPRINEWKTDVESLEEHICDAIDADLNPNGTLLSTVYVDNAVIGTYTFTGSNRQSYTYSLPNELYGRTLYAIYNGTAFKHYKTWFHKRPEPDRWSNFVSDRQTRESEQLFHTFECEVNPLGNTVLATTVINNTAVATYTITGNGRRHYPFGIPVESYGNTVYTIYNVSGGARFKFYKEWYDATEEPDRVTPVETDRKVWPSGQYLKTWRAELNPLGTCMGTLYIDETAITTQTFAGTAREAFVWGLDVSTSMAIQAGTSAYAVYNGATGAVLKHYRTDFETAPKPFGKRTWAIHYNKIGGASQLDLGRFWSIDVEVPTGTATLTSIWDIDGTAFSTNTLTFTASREWRDRISFPPGGRGYLFQQRLLSDVAIKIWRASLDCQRVGVKGLARNSDVPGVIQQ